MSLLTIQSLVYQDDTRRVVAYVDDDNLRSCGPFVDMPNLACEEITAHVRRECLAPPRTAWVIDSLLADRDHSARRTTFRATLTAHAFAGIDVGARGRDVDDVIREVAADRDLLTRHTHTAASIGVAVEPAARGVSAFHSIMGDLQAIDDFGAVDFDRLMRARYPGVSFRVNPIAEAEARLAELAARYQTGVTMIAPPDFGTDQTVLTISSTGEVDLHGRTVDESARTWWRGALGQDDRHFCIGPDGEAIVDVGGSTSRRVVLFRDGTWDALAAYEPTETSRAFWAAVASCYASLPVWLLPAPEAA